MSDTVDIITIGEGVTSSNDNYIHLYDKQETSHFEGNGVAVLQPIECKLDTSKWEWTMTLPKDDWGKWKLIEPLSIVKSPCYTENSQLWRIKTIEEGDQEITVTGTPIFFDINWLSPFPFRFYSTGYWAMRNYQSKISSYPFVLESDSSTKGIWTNKTDNDWLGTNFLTAVNGNAENSFTRIYGGLVMYDNFHIKVLKTPTDKGLTYKYGMNLPAGVLKESIDVSNLTTRIIAGGKDAIDDRWLYVTQSTGGQTETVKFITSDLINNYPATIRPVKVIRYEDIKYKSYDDGQTTEGEVYTNISSFFQALETRARLEYTENHIDEPRVNIEINLSNMNYTADIIRTATNGGWNSEQIRQLQQATLGEKVTIQHDGMGLNISGRITDVVYNALTRSCEKITIGNERVTYNKDSLYTLINGGD